MSDDDITVWITQAKDGDQQACRNLWVRYVGQLTQVAKRNIKHLPTTQFDEEDIVQSAMKSFFLRVRKSDDSIAGRDQLWRLLVTITRRKAIAAQRRVFAKKRHPSLQDPSLVDLNSLCGNEPTPEFAAMVAENCDALLQLLLAEGDGLYEIALLKLEGYTNKECAELRSTTSRTIERKLSRIRQIWSDHSMEDES